MTRERILLSGPDVGPVEREALLNAFDSGWIAPVGPELTAFEAELAEYVGVESCVALTSGTAALHLGLMDLGVGPGDEVVVQTATFAASAFAVTYTGATPVFCDVDSETWCLDPDLLAELLAEKAASNQLPKAVMPVDLYGSCANYRSLSAVCAEYEVPLIEDAAEALGTIGTNGRAGSFGELSVVSFNGNKIMTTSGGGALLGSKDAIEKARYLSTQARLPGVHYEHIDIGYNYRLSNLLAGLGRAQLANLETMIDRRTVTAERYRSDERLSTLDWCPYDGTQRPNHWLNVGLLPPGMSPIPVCEKLDAQGIEARPAWKPMHLQPVFKECEAFGGKVAESLFDNGICLPSGSGLSADDQEYVIATISPLLLEGSSL